MSSYSVCLASNICALRVTCDNLHTVLEWVRLRYQTRWEMEHIHGLYTLKNTDVIYIIAYIVPNLEYLRILVQRFWDNKSTLFGILDVYSGYQDFL